MLLLLIGVAVVLAGLFLLKKVHSKNRAIYLLTDPSKILPGSRNPLAFLRDSKGDVETQARIFLTLGKTYGPAAAYWLGPFHGILLTHPDAAKEFLHSSHDPDFHRLKPPYDRFGYDIIGESLIQKDGKDWKDQRDILAPAFHHVKIKTLVSTFLELTHKARDIWVKKAEEGGPINVIPWVSSLTLDIIGKAGFGFDFGALDSKLSKYQEAYNFVFKYFLDPLRFFIPGYEYFPTSTNKKVAEDVSLLNNLMLSMIKDRRANPHTEPSDLLDMMLGENADGTLSDKTLKDNLFLLFVAGHETTSSTISMAINFFATNPDMQTRARNEVLQVLGSDTTRDFNWDDLNKLEYLNAFIRETLRLYPPAHMLIRGASKDVEIQGYHVPKGEIVMVSLFALHRHPDFWTDPEKFDPERFLNEKGDKHPYAWIPFSAGPRACLGLKFAMTELKIVLASILQRLVIRAPPGHKMEIDRYITMRPKNPLNLTFEKFH